MQAGECLGQLSQFMVVGGKERFRAFLTGTVEMFDNGPRNAQPVISTCSATDLVKYDQTGGRAIIENIRGLVHLDHEGGVAPGQFVPCPDP